MESQLPVNNSPQPEETVGAVLLKTLARASADLSGGDRSDGRDARHLCPLRQLQKPILLGAALGGGVSLLNFFFLIVGVLRAARNENPLTAQLKAVCFTSCAPSRC